MSTPQKPPRTPETAGGLLSKFPRRPAPSAEASLRVEQDEPATARTAPHGPTRTGSRWQLCRSSRPWPPSSGGAQCLLGPGASPLTSQGTVSRLQGSPAFGPGRDDDATGQRCPLYPPVTFPQPCPHAWATLLPNLAPGAPRTCPTLHFKGEL